jgi:hypothetical protein
MIEGDDVDAALCDPHKATCTVGRDLNDITPAFQIPLDEPAQPGIVIDVENPSVGCGH